MMRTSLFNCYPKASKILLFYETDFIVFRIQGNTFLQFQVSSVTFQITFFIAMISSKHMSMTKVHSVTVSLASIAYIKLATKHPLCLPG